MPTPSEREIIKEKKLEKNREYNLLHREERAKSRKAWQEKNKERVAEYHKQYVSSHKEEIADYQRAHQKVHKEEIKEYQKEYQKKYHLTHKNNYKREYGIRAMKNPKRRLSCYLRNRLNSAIKKNQRSGSAVRDLGCTIPELRFYLEGKFQDSMTWENWSLHGWHIDHVIPLAFFDLTDREQLLKAVHYTNLQPLWAMDNWKKPKKQVVDKFISNASI